MGHQAIGSRPWTIGSPASKLWAREAGGKQLTFQIERFGNIAHLWSSYALSSDGMQVGRGINSIEAIKEAGGWRVTSIMVRAESAPTPLLKQYLP